MLYLSLVRVLTCIRNKDLPEMLASWYVGRNPNPKEEEVDRIANVERDS